MNDMDNLRITTKGVSASGKSWLKPVLYYSNGRYGSYKADNADFRKFIMCPEWESLLPILEPRLSNLEEGAVCPW